MPWAQGLLPDQRTAACHVGQHARLLAGPGTGKTLTLTRRICYLVEDLRVESDAILALTFTRAAAFELRQRVEAELGADRLPRIVTLHSFALRQLLRNANRITLLPQPLRIADDWEERHIVLEDLKALLNLNRVSDAQNLLNELSADWQSLTADEADWERRFPNPQFLGAWREHRRVYGYVLRAELVYQLKRALEMIEDFSIEGTPQHLLVDEYQDLNRCDLAVVRAVGERGAEVFSAGDDDQSIYGFRKAHPDGIRRFPQDYQPSQPLALEICMRCDPAILDLALFVARQDHRRLEKPLRCEDGRAGGEVALLRFTDHDQEVIGIAGLCRYLIDRVGYQPHDILILLRSDRNGAFSSPITAALQREMIDVAIATAEGDPLDESPGRQVLALLHLAINAEDNLAWRTLLLLRSNGIGAQGIATLYQRAAAAGTTFTDAIRDVAADPTIIARHGNRIKAEFETITAALDQLNVEAAHDGNPVAVEAVLEVVDQAIQLVSCSPEEAEAIRLRFETTSHATHITSLEQLLRALEVSDEGLEQEVEEGRVNILTMHRAKGLTAKAVIVVAAEDEYIPGRAEGDQVDDERRLLYVSLTRAKHYLFMTFCQRRTGPQQHTGRTSGQPRRTLTQFLQGAPVAPVPGAEYVRQLSEAAV